MDSERFVGMSKGRAAAAALALLLAPGGISGRPLQASTATAVAPRQVDNSSKFYCNVKALTPAERARHRHVTEKLITARKEIVETPRGYEFQYSPSDVSVAELAEWVTTEEKCCPFFYFHVDLEREGTLVCLGLTGEEGIKAFIRAEFQVPAK
jgi:hypothetical protein